MEWTRKELKSNAKHILRRNYIQIVIVCLIVGLIIGGYTSYEDTFETRQNEEYLSKNSVSNSVIDILDNAGVEIERREENLADRLDHKFNLRNASEGFFASIINNSLVANSFLIGILNTANEIIFNSRLLESSIMTIATILLFGFWFFIQNILVVGECRFHLENKYYRESNLTSVLFVYRVKKTLHVAYIMFLKYIFLLLWSFTLIGGLYKYYDYRMIPYILAENPEIPRKEVFKLSHNMMKGNKWKAFKLDISFIAWHFISFLTFGIARNLYVNPLIAATNSELYYSLREGALATSMEASEYLNDIYLSESMSQGLVEYPIEEYSIPMTDFRKKIKLDYDRKYSLNSYILIFFAMCLIGWIWEVSLHLMGDGIFVNRGTMLGPWLPIYGTGSILMLLVLKKLANKPLVLFPSIFVLCGLLEYSTSWALEKIFNTSWWDYSNVFFNLNGRVSFEGLLFFTLGGFMVIYFIAPMLDEILKHISSEKKKLISLVLIVLFSIDLVYSFNNPNQGEGISSPVGKNTSEIIEII